MFMTFQNKYLLGEEDIYFSYKGTGNELIALLEERVDTGQESFMSFRKKMFYGVVKKEDIHLVLNKYSILWPKMYCFDGKIYDDTRGATLYLKYKLRVFSKIYVLLWFNFILLTLAGFAVALIWLFLKNVFAYTSEVETTSFSDATGYGLMILVASSLLLFGILITRLMKFFESYSKNTLNQLLLDIGCTAQGSDSSKPSLG